MSCRKIMVTGMSEVLQKMIGVITLGGLSEYTQENYERTVSNLALHYHCLPQDLSGDQIKAWVIGCINQGLKPRTTNADISALRLFYDGAMGQHGNGEGLLSRLNLPSASPNRLPKPQFVPALALAEAPNISVNASFLKQR